MGVHNDLGKRGEILAVAHLKKKGYSILQRNYRFRKGEIDIIAAKGEILAIVEVKSRSSVDFEPIAGTVGRKKIGLLVQAADQYVTSQNPGLQVRFDIITIYFKGSRYEVDHLEDAFYFF